MGVTRRRFVQRAGVAAASLAGLPAIAAATPARAAGAARQPAPTGSANIPQRAIALGPGGVGETQTYAANRRFLTETNTRWVRLWATWPTLQPEPGTPPGAGGDASAAALARLDADIDQAKRDGRSVMLTAWRFPTWANDTTTQASPPAHDPTFKFPQDLSPGSPWAQLVDFLLTRYGDRLDALELLNEPNLQLWPQAEAADAVARMFVTAQTVASRHLAAPLLVGPATSDGDGDSPSSTRSVSFTRDLLDALDERGFVPGPNFAWSHHSYTDVEEELSGEANRAAAVRAALTGRWPGWPTGDPSQPGLLITETGARLDRIATLYGLQDPAAARARQAELLDRYWRRIQFGPEGAGVGMVCQYLFVTDANYDSGLCDLDGTPRPAYAAWAKLPAFTAS
jgi:hypothetical protein